MSLAALVGQSFVLGSGGFCHRWHALRISVPEAFLADAVVVVDPDSSAGDDLRAAVVMLSWLERPGFRTGRTAGDQAAAGRHPAT